MKIESDYKNWTINFEKCNANKEKCRQELMPNTKFLPYRVFVPNDLVEREIKSSRLSTKDLIFLLSWTQT